MAIEAQSRADVRIGSRSIDELEAAMTKALASLLGDKVQIEIKKIVRWENEVTGLEIAAAIIGDDEETAFAIG